MSSERLDDTCYKDETFRMLTHDIVYFAKNTETDSKIGTFDSWEIIDEVTAIKTCDKSFFEYNGSGVPKGICWFFGAEELETSENKAFSAKGRVTLANGNVICEFQVKDLTPDGANAGRQTWQCDGIELFFDRAPEQIQLPHPEVYTQEVFRMFINPYDKKKLTLEHCKGIGLTEKDCSLKVNIENDGYRIRLEFPLKYGKWLGFTWKANNAGKKMQTLAWGTPGRDDFFKNRLAFGCVSSD
jgi:hypothetical protein